MSNTFSVFANGIEYQVLVAHNGDVMWIDAVNSEGDTVRVADAERDTAVEQLFVTYFGEDESQDVDGPSELYWKNDPRATAEWIVNCF
jgi:hypothetical protein